MSCVKEVQRHARGPGCRKNAERPPLTPFEKGSEMAYDLVFRWS